MEKTLIDVLMEMFFKLPKEIKQYKMGTFVFSRYENNAVGFRQNDALVHKFYSSALCKDKRTVSSQTGKFVKDYYDGQMLSLIYSENDLLLTQMIRVDDPSLFTIQVKVEDKSGKEIAFNYIRVMDFAYPDAQCNPLFLSLDQKMLLMPYDNDMWVHYESTYLRPGRISYEATCIYNDDDLNGLLIGAIDFDNFKNGIRCSDHDARCYYALSGVADDGTHDIVPHGYLSGKEICSSRFVCGYFDDIRDGLEIYGKKAMEDKFVKTWSGKVPFGWNSYSAGCFTLEQWDAAGQFISKELNNFGDEDKVTYINLDANFMLNKEKMAKIVKELHARGQKAGNYLAPALGNEMFAKIAPLKGSKGAKYEDIIMKKEDGSLYPKIDGGKPIDVTNPIFIRNLEILVNEIVEMGFDYLKVDFTSHAGVEGKRYDPTITTGRQALTFFYKTLNDLLDPRKIGREIFLDFSISPLFPGGYANGRRSCCDAFGHHEDVEYVLNALNYGWWQSGSLVQFNDPDHTVLYKSKVDGRSSTDFNEAKSRYNASLISGTVMLLSDNFGPSGNKQEIEESKKRVKEIANNSKLNAIASIGKPFRPVYLKSETCNIYYLHNGERNYVAFFNFKDFKQEFSIDADKMAMPLRGTLIDLRTDEKKEYTEKINVSLEGYDSVIFEIESR